MVVRRRTRVRGGDGDQCARESCTVAVPYLVGQSASDRPRSLRARVARAFVPSHALTLASRAQWLMLYASPTGHSSVYVDAATLADVACRSADDDDDDVVCRVFYVQICMPGWRWRFGGVVVAATLYKFMLISRLASSRSRRAKHVHATSHRCVLSRSCTHARSHEWTVKTTRTKRNVHRRYADMPVWCGV